jgi:hypothetical protein
MNRKLASQIAKLHTMMLTADWRTDSDDSATSDRYVVIAANVKIAFDALVIAQAQFEIA